MKLYVIRHGETDYNLNNIIAGITDVPLNETGISQAKKTAELMENIEYDIIFCSPLLRTKQTMEIVNVKKKDVIYDDRIIERNAGRNETVSRELVNLDDYWDYNYKDKSFNGSETLTDILKRVCNFLEELKSNYSDKNILLVTHNGVCRLINYYASGMRDSKDIKRYSQKNAELKIYDI